MSDYSPEIPYGQKAVKVPPAGVEVLLSPEETQSVIRFLSNPAVFPDAFKSWIVQYIALNGEQIPRSQIVGGGNLPNKTAEVDTFQSTTSATYTNLSTTGPEITGLSDGTYLVQHGCTMDCVSETWSGYQSLSYNGSTAVDGDAVIQGFTVTGGAATEKLIVTGSRSIIKSLANDNNNTITAKYKSGAGHTVNFYYRWVIAIKLGS